MDTLGLWLNFMTIFILIKSLFPEMIFFFFFCLFLIAIFVPLPFPLSPFPFLTDYHYAVQAAFELTTLLQWLFQAGTASLPLSLDLPSFLTSPSAAHQLSFLFF